MRSTMRGGAGHLVEEEGRSDEVRNGPHELGEVGLVGWWLLCDTASWHDRAVGIIMKVRIIIMMRSAAL